MTGATGRGRWRLPLPGIRGRSNHPARQPFANGVLAMPVVIVFTLMVVIPVAITIGYSFTDLSLLRPAFEWVGLDNYGRIARSNDFFHAILITGFIAIFSVVIPNAIGLGVASLLNVRSRAFDALRVLFFIPFVLAPVVVGFIFVSILTDRGLLNTALGALGIDTGELSWIGNPQLALLSVSIALGWQLAAFCTVTYFAALRSIPPELDEAATIDGANTPQRFRFVTWPLVAPAMTINTVVALISAFKMYDHVLVLTGGGPGRATETIALAVIRTGFSQNRGGVASAMAVVLLVMSALIVLATLVALRRREVEL